MKTIKSVFAIAFQNIRKWRTDYKIYLIAAILFSMVIYAAHDIKVHSDYLPMTVWIFPFLCVSSFRRLLLTAPLVLLFCNAPFADRNQTFVYLRSGRMKWLCGQILYIVLASGIYYLFMFFASILSVGFGADFSLQWNTMAKSIAGAPKITPYFTPLTSTWFTFLFSWLSGIFIGLLMFFCNYMTAAKPLGMFLSSFFVMLGVVSNYSEQQPVEFNKIVRFSPLSWNYIGNIAIGDEKLRPSFVYVMCVYCGLIVLLSAAILIFGRRKSLDIRED